MFALPYDGGVNLYVEKESVFLLNFQKCFRKWLTQNGLYTIISQCVKVCKRPAKAPV